MTLDRLDHRILSALQHNARITNLELAKAVGLSPAQCLRRHRAEIRRLVSRWTGEYQFTLEQVLNEMIGRCRELKLRAVGSERQLRMDFAVLLTVSERFFCPALELVSDYLRLPPVVAGATLLSFGNGAPDTFTQVAAVAQGLGATVTGKARSPKPKPETLNPKPKTLNASGWRR